MTVAYRTDFDFYGAPSELVIHFNRYGLFQFFEIEPKVELSQHGIDVLNTCCGLFSRNLYATLNGGMSVDDIMKQIQPGSIESRIVKALNFAMTPPEGASQ